MEADQSLNDPTDTAKKLTTWDNLFKGKPFDGVVIVAGDTQVNVANTLSNISTGLIQLSAASQAIPPVIGDVRPGKMRGFEQ